ncbi:type IV pilus assembly protein FimV [Psychrobacter aquaticus]|uniref:Tfp pilus assembly protein FimV n=1 Tax=Psychrobacter aquaticus CMS 56 TaxID=1354303 RepID=U4T1Z2_9GAMM|nr:Tfp pilus assembly protein FimV [Psychrobacter aquaticus]ERL54877.1 Tfp pilus assembly protein FimV [Psychrobacter aquaticus CMS 56]
MSCHLSHRLTTVHRAISMALLCSVGYATLASTAQAATIGKTVVTSAQHEPLAASIVVTNIRSADFSASLANPIIYQQMGLTPTDSMTVRFKPTSATSGQVFITTSKPVSKPFADVVLAIEDNGQRNVIPKTLLMPLDTSLPIAMPKNIVTGAKKPNLPSVSANNAQPLTVRKGAPPPLIAVSQSSSTPKSSTSELIASRLPAPSINAAGIQVPTVTTTSQNNNLTYASSRLDNGRLNTTKNTGTINISSNNNQNAANSVMDNKTITNDAATLPDKAMVAENGKPKTAIITDKQLDILNIQVTRQIQPSSQADVGMMAASPIIPTPNNNNANVLNPNIDISIATAATSNVTANTVASTAPSNVKNNAFSANKTTNNSTTTQYQVQRNDSLWVIAQQIAQENNLDIQTVMKEIQSQNPDAFINKDAGQLKADAKLSLPSYDVLPSQKNLEAAISAQRPYSRRAHTPVATKTTKTSVKKSSETTQTAKVRKKPTVTKTQTLPKAQFSVLAPDNNGSAEGTQVKSAAKTGNGLSTDILATLKASRQSTASQAQRLSKTSSALDSYTKKIQLQNQKLAELQARLKKLRNQ